MTRESVLVTLAVTLAVALAWWAFFTPPAKADAVCGERRAIIADLEKTYSEVPVSIGLETNGSVIEVLASPSGSFTIILTQPNGLACVMAAGENWENLPKRLTTGKKISFDAPAQAPPGLGFKVGDVAPFTSLCQPNANGIVLRAFIEGGLELAQKAFREQVASGGCDVFTDLFYAEIKAISYIGLFHSCHLFAIRFGNSFFNVTLPAL